MAHNRSNLVVIIPCKDEADNLEQVVRKLRALKPKSIIIGIDPSTSDKTVEVAHKLDCITVIADRSGYDSAVYAATNYSLKNYPDSQLLYTDAGNKYGYQQVSQMVTMIERGYDMVLAIRNDTNNTMKFHQKLGTKLVLVLINTLSKQKIRDISPFRLVNSNLFDVIKMNPRKYRWPSELLVKSLSAGLKIGQVDVESLPRQGTSKVSASIGNSVRAGFEMFSSLQFFNYKQESRNVSEKN